MKERETRVDKRNHDAEVVGKAVGLFIIAVFVAIVWLVVISFGGGLLVWWWLPVIFPAISIGYWQSVLLVLLANLVLLPLKSRLKTKTEKEVKK